MKVIVRFEDVPNGRIPQVGMNNLMIINDGRIRRWETMCKRIDRIVRMWHKNRIGKLYEVTHFDSGEVWFMGQVT